MATKFDDFYREIEREAEAEGSEAVEQLATFKAHFRLGRRIAEARHARKLSQKAVAQLAGVDQSDVSNIERGATNPTFNTFNAVVCAVGMEIDLKEAKPAKSRRSRPR